MYFYFVRPKIPPYELEKNLVKLVREPLKNVCGEDFASATAPALLYYMASMPLRQILLKKRSLHAVNEHFDRTTAADKI
jgi:hypothetical protein